MQTFQEMIDGCMDNFNFDEVAVAMKALGWKWQDVGTPDVYDLRRCARELLKDVIARNCYKIATGGFEAIAHIDEGEIYRLELKFVVSSWEEDVDDSIN